jgi:hypothetical protein|tara:strand:- start:172 stop:471 length:300 start_codon:yes stop_codon:yes gene_type:complete
MSASLKLSVPQTENVVSVRTSSHRGFTPEELAAECVGKIISVSDTALPGIRDQARAFGKNMETLVASYMRQAIQSDRTTVFNAIVDAGHPQLAELIRRL